jgi:hypothetical protein
MTSERVRYSCIALHPLAEKENGRTYTRDQLQTYGESLSFKPLSINHGSVNLPEYQNDPYSQLLEYPENRCLSFAYSPALDALVGKIELVKDSIVDLQIQQREIRHVSCENFRQGDSLEFRALTLLRKNRTPRDRAAVIIPESRELAS